MSKAGTPARCAALVGSYTSGKTTLLEAMLKAAGTLQRKGSVNDGNSVGDAGPEARAHGMSAELNVAHADYLGDQWYFLDCPGSIELAQEARDALMAADVAVIVAEPELEKAVALSPLFRFLEDQSIPHMLFINKMDKATARVRDILAAIQEYSSRPLVLRQVPMRDGEDVVGAVDLVSERAWQYQEHKPSNLVEMPDSMRDRESEARQEMLEALADFDDALLEELLEDKIPANDEVYAQLEKDLAEDLIVPVFLGSAEHDNGIHRLLKALRHEVPGPDAAMERLGLPGGPMVASIVKTFHLPHTGKVSVARVWRGEIKEGASFDGERASALLRLQGGHQEKVAKASAGEIVGLGRLESLRTGDIIGENGKLGDLELERPAPLTPVYALAIQPVNRQDEVKLTGSLAKLIEEDPSLSVEHSQDTHQMLLWGQGNIHLQLAAERLKNKYHVEVATEPARPAYKETIRRGTKYHSRYKRQTGGHGQFADIHVEIQPVPRGEGFAFHDKIVGGVVPRQYIPAVENGVKESLVQGPLGFPVVDVAVTLYDGQHHSVDSSEMAFKIAGRQAMNDALPECQPVLLEPISEVTIAVPNAYTSKVHTLISGRRGQVLGFDARAGWQGWDEVKAFMPQSETLDLILELRSLSQGVGTFSAKFDHLQELTGKPAERVKEMVRQAAQ